MTKPMIDRILNDIELLYKNNTDRYEVFMSDVDKKVFFDYLSVVPFEMNIQEIQKRLEHIYYRHSDVKHIHLSLSYHSIGHHCRYPVNQLQLRQIQ